VFILVLSFSNFHHFDFVYVNFLLLSKKLTFISLDEEQHLDFRAILYTTSSTNLYREKTKKIVKNFPVYFQSY
jgi:hypothetical protein